MSTLFRTGRIRSGPTLERLEAFLVFVLLASAAPGQAAERGQAARRPSGEHAAAQASLTVSTQRVAASSLDALFSTNLVHLQPKSKQPDPGKDYQREIDAARVLRLQKENAAAAKLLLTLLEENLPVEFRRATMFELAMVAQDASQLGRAQQILSQYLQLFPQDPTVPEVLLRQGLIYRQMGANGMAITKFYAVMNSALSMQADQFDYYKRLVLQSQTEIADTYYIQGKYQEAIDFFKRILKQNSPELNKPQIHFKYIRCLTALGRHAEAIAECELFIEAYPAAVEAPELRFICADSLRQLGRRRDAMLQVLNLLESQKDTAKTNPESWAYWQQRAGNQIANEFYKEGDYLSALEIYNRLATLNTNASWQLPVWYQIGLIFERLQQPGKAVEKFAAIVAREKEVVSTDDSPGVATVVEMAKWRKQNIGWQARAEVAIQGLKIPSLPDGPTNSLTPPQGP